MRWSQRLSGVSRLRRRQRETASEREAWKALPLILVVVVVIVGAIVALVTHVPTLVMLVGDAVVVISGLYYIHGMRIARTKRRMSGEREVRYSNSFISRKDFYRDVRWRLEENILPLHRDKDEAPPALNVYWVSRQSGAYTVLMLVPAVFLLLGSLGVGVWLAAWPPKLPYPNMPAAAVMFALALLLAGYTGYVTLEWIYSYVVVTDYMFIRMTTWPAWLWWADYAFDKMPLDAIHVVEKHDTKLGNWFGYGIITLDSPASRDERFHGMTGMRMHDKLTGITTSAMKQAKER
jgi:hypothetical protein